MHWPVNLKYSQTFMLPLQFAVHQGIIFILINLQVDYMLFSITTKQKNSPSKYSDIFHRAALLTGKYPQSTGIYPGVFWPDSVGGLSAAKYPTISSKLRDAGYATSHIGKWHLGVGRNGEYLPTKHGFERYLSNEVLIGSMS